ncbi:MAG: hypothetical protein ACR2L2_08780 [Acidobacteriota bacterium]
MKNENQPATDNDPAELPKQTSEKDAYDRAVNSGRLDETARRKIIATQADTGLAPPPDMTDEEAENLGVNRSAAKPAISKEDDYSNRVRTLYDDREGPKDKE